MTQHPLTPVLLDAMDVARGGAADPIQGSVRIRTIDGQWITGQICWVSDDGQLFSILRLDNFDQRAETPRHLVTAHVIEVHFHQAGA